MIEILRRLEPAYQPSSETGELIADKNLIAIIGAFAVGKTKLIEVVAASHPAYTDVVSFTTRPSRGSGDKYRFMEHTADNLQQLITRVRNGELVNFTVHPTMGYVYGSEPSDYRSLNCMLADTVKSYESDKMLPFASVRPVVVVAEPQVWLDRIAARATNPSELQARIAEARQSLEWSLDSKDALFIDNSSEICSAATNLIRALEDGVINVNTGRNTVNAMLRACTDLP